MAFSDFLYNQFGSQANQGVNQPSPTPSAMTPFTFMQQLYRQNAPDGIVPPQQVSALSPTLSSGIGQNSAQSQVPGQQLQQDTQSALSPNAGQMPQQQVPQEQGGGGKKSLMKLLMMMA